MRNKVIQITSLVAIILASHFASGNVANDQARDLLIEKFTRIYSQLPNEDPARIPVTLRLADLLSEKARKMAMAELDAGCIQCDAGQRERKDALRYYGEVLNKVSESQRNRVLSQMGHLYEMTGDAKKAVELYSKIAKQEEDAQLRAGAFLSLAELFFRQKKYDLALKNYNSALSFEELGRKGLASYRRAWCLFNMGDIAAAKKAMVKILNDPKLLTRAASTSVVSVDSQFQEEVSRDLATFYSKSQVSTEQVAELYELSPKEAQLSNMVYLAGELERMGNKKTAIDVWKFVQGKQSDPGKRLEGHVRLAQLELDLGARDKSVEQYLKALRQWQAMGSCTEDSCGELKSRLRKYILDWNREEKKKPSEELFVVYNEYIRVFDTEVDMILWAAQVADLRKDNASTFDLRRRAVPLVAAKSPAQLKSEKLPSLEDLLLLLIETGEKTGNPDNIQLAQKLYLDQSREKTKTVEVQYQMAHKIYKDGQYREAAGALKAVALLPGDKAIKIKKQAADLALDALVLLKSDGELESWAGEFAQAFPQHRSEFKNIERKSVLNQSANLARSGDDQLQAAWTTLERMDLDEANEKDQLAYYKNRLVMAEKLKKYEEAWLAADQIMGMKLATSKDREFALSRKAWLAELKLDFKTALELLERLKTPELSREQRFLKLGLFAELADQNSKPYYNQYIKVSSDKEKARALASKLIKESNNPQKDLERLMSYFKGHEVELSEMQYQLYLEGKDNGRAKKLLTKKPYLRTRAGKNYWREGFLAKFEKYKSSLSSMVVESSSDKKLSRSLKNRIRVLDKGEKHLKNAIEMKDWMAQMLVVKFLADETNRFYEEILSLPIPADLDERQQQEYMQLLSQQAAPYQVRSSELSKKFDEFWAKPEVIGQLREGYIAASDVERPKISQQISLIRAVAPEVHQAALGKIEGISVVEEPMPNLTELETARRGVRENPMDPEKIEHLIGLEKRMGRTAMVSYLSGRLDIAKSAQPQEVKSAQ